jgi:hypothetical protein
MLRNGFMLVVAVLGIASCSDRASITIRNASSAAVYDLRAEGRCFSENLGTIAPGASRTIRVKPCGESDISLHFSASGQQHDAHDLAYIEANSLYDVTLDIGPDLKVRTSYR